MTVKHLRNALFKPFLSILRKVEKTKETARKQSPMVPVTMKSGLNSAFSWADSNIDSISLNFYAISRLFAFMYSSATARCSSLYFLNTEQ